MLTEKAQWVARMASGMSKEEVANARISDGKYKAIKVVTDAESGEVVSEENFIWNQEILDLVRKQSGNVVYEVKKRLNIKGDGNEV